MGRGGYFMRVRQNRKQREMEQDLGRKLTSDEALYMRLSSSDMQSRIAGVHGNVDMDGIMKRSLGESYSLGADFKAALERAYSPGNAYESYADELFSGSRKNELDGLDKDAVQVLHDYVRMLERAVTVPVHRGCDGVAKRPLLDEQKEYLAGLVDAAIASGNPVKTAMDDMQQNGTMDRYISMSADAYEEKYSSHGWPKEDCDGFRSHFVEHWNRRAAPVLESVQAAYDCQNGLRNQRMADSALIGIQEQAADMQEAMQL